MLTSRSLRAAARAAFGLSLVLADGRRRHSRPTRARQSKAPVISEYAPTLSQPLPPTPVANGSIFQASMGYAPLTSGAPAPRSVGDSGHDRADREHPGAEDQFGFDRSFEQHRASLRRPPGALSLVHRRPTRRSVPDRGRSRARARPQQSNQLSGAITVTIAQVYPNGTYLLRGEKHLTLNRGDEVIQISGMVRATDIDSNNSVLVHPHRGRAHHLHRQGRDRAGQLAGLARPLLLPRQSVLRITDREAPPSSSQ